MSKLKILLSVIIGVGTTLFAGSTLLAAEDAVPPNISNITVTNVTTSSATIKWNTDELATSLVRFGTSTNYGLFATSSLLAINHWLGINGLATTTPYHFSVSSSDVFGNTATSTDRTFTTLSTTTPPTATTTVQAKLQISPKSLNIKKPGKKIQAIIRLPKGTTFEGLDTASIRLNGTIAPVDTDLRPAIWQRWGRYRRTLIAKFNVSDILPSIATSTSSFNLTITGNIKAGTFTATDTIKIVPKPKKIEIKIERIQDRLEDARERIKKAEERIRERLEDLRDR